MPADHDLDRQYRQTTWVWNDLRSKGVNFERTYKLDLHFIPTAPSADREGFAEALRAAGYEVRLYQGGPTIQATTPAMELTPESIWLHEHPTTVSALSYGFAPDGWGFLED
ncbi:MAG: ribonuclease E inhibitor RraB [Kiloniellaceae bacterium]